METKKGKIKIAQVVGNAKTGGVISCVINFYRNIDRDKFVFHFYTYGESPYDGEIRRLGGEVFYIPSVLNFPKSVSQMVKYFKNGGYAAVHAHLTTLSVVPLFAARLAGVKTRICHAHSTSHKTEKVRIVKNALRPFSRLFPTHIAGCSRYSCEWLYGKRKGKQAFLLRNAIDLSRFCPDAENSQRLKAEYGLSGRKVIGCVGRFVFQKNIPFLVEVFAMLGLADKNAVLVLVGDGKERPLIEERIRRFNLEGGVIILPEIPDVEKYYALFDLFALPSRFEGLPLVAVEAQAMGIPCLLSDEITPEVNITGQCEFLPIDSPGEWADKMGEILGAAQKYDLRDRISDAGYDIKKEAKRLEEFYLSTGERNGY
ncbi:MAG TPA: glycosyltransferase [Clostridia bacterium]|nr:glycosyltransferase [Clostridia bacterium]